MRRHAVLLAAALTVTLAACGSPEQEPESSGGITWDAEAQQYVMEEEIASGEAALTVWFEEETLAEAEIAAFNEVYPDVRVEYEIVPKVDAVDKMALAGEAGNGADVYMTAYDRLSDAIADGTAAPLGEYQSVLADRMSDTFIGVVSKDGAMYGVPTTTESIALMYNETLLAELTGSSEPATTWEEIVDLAEEYNDPAANQWTIRFLAGEVYYAYPVLSSLGWHAYPEGEVTDPGLDADTLADGLEYYAGLREIWDVPSADATWETIEEAFAQGETPYVITGPWSFETFDAGAEENGFSYGVTTLPQVAEGGPAASLAGMNVTVVSGYTEYPAAARVFASFMASDAGAAALYEATGQIPALKADLLGQIEGISEDPHVAGIVAQSEQADLIPQVPQYFWETSNTLIVNVWDGLAEVPEAQEQAVTSYAELAGL